MGIKGESRDIAIDALEWKCSQHDFDTRLTVHSA